MYIWLVCRIVVMPGNEIACKFTRKSQCGPIKRGADGQSGWLNRRLDLWWCEFNLEILGKSTQPKYIFIIARFISFIETKIGSKYDNLERLPAALLMSQYNGLMLLMPVNCRLSASERT